MIIEEKDFKVIFKDECYTLYLIKSKKEIKDSDSDSELFKIGGYFTFIDSLIRRIIYFRNSKKYPGKETTELLTDNLNKIIDIRAKLENTLKSINNPIYELMTKLNIK
jgi:hypothetical protein